MTCGELIKDTEELSAMREMKQWALKPGNLQT